MKSDRMKASPQVQSYPHLQRSIGIAALLCLAFLTSIPAPVAAADREVLYSKAEDLIRYTDDVKGLSALLASHRDMPVLIPARQGWRRYQ
jgi:hypothetical protein